MIIQELAYKVTVKADEFLNGKRKVSEEVSKLNKELSRAEKDREKELKKQREELEKFGKTATSAFRNVTAAAAGFLGIGAGLYGIKQLFTSTSDEIVRASTQAKFFGTDVNKMFGVRRGFQQAGLNADAFIGASGNARMALANIKDPTIFGGLTGAAQNLMVLGARTGLNINNLGDPNKALGEFTRYGKSHSQENLMQVMAAAGFDPTDAAKIKSGELKSLVDSETKKSNITAQQVREQEKLMVTLGQLDSQFTRLKTDLAIAFAPEVVNGLKAFGSWIEKNHGNIIGFFDDAGKTAKRFTEAVGGAENALKLLAAAYVGSKVTGAGIPPWLAGLVAYGTYLYNDQNNIKDSAESSLNYAKRNVGDMLRGIGIDTDLGRKPGTVNGDNIQWDIPGSTDVLLDAIRKVESSDGAHLYSPKGAVGEYQIMADTGRELGLRIDSQVDERLDPEKSRAASSSYISKLLKKYDGNLNDALMAYNWGMGNVDQWIEQGRGAGFTDKNGNWRPLPKETRDYTGKIRSAMGFGDDSSLSYYQKQQSLLTAPRPGASSVDNSKTSSININNVNVNSNPQSVDALAKNINQQVARASTNAAFSSGVVS
ncbi:lytic transglycosylase domain-containing protein [Salmonella enterica subsp. enterica serovar Newport]|nr:lytic transglycosylase domain-containing protein [Salmonella enterica subsp. enterica serovar Newport]EBY2764822.1 lytic transglycosylase domain-containing protein [Salmonella enterica subsp. enterica serovar Newport]EBY4191329.1 lytic transglycosylase domain-containing protein [Salmonella enterica subsp. enterica serovar Newport]ECU5322142.1 lytic transglycosylase domain-containing protein [Salmonella enterica]EHF1575222.1 lytic transglycosylase domain-containing protein [Salmonella enteric